MNTAHYRKLENMFIEGPINKLLLPKITVSDKSTTITMETQEQFFHAGNALHGSIYFKMLDDAAYFACQSVVEDYFIVTANFNISLLRPIGKEKITAIGNVLSLSKNTFTAESKLYNEQGKLLAFGTGTFMKSPLPISNEIGYA